MKKKAFPLSRVYTQLETGPVVLLTTAKGNRNNVMTMSWHTMLDFEPPLIGCVISNMDYTFNTLKKTKECVIAIPTLELARKVVKVGNTSGRNIDKFKTYGLTPIQATSVKAPLVGECYINLECKVVDTTLINKYNFFVLEVLKAWINPEIKNPKTFHHKGNGVFMVAGKTIKIPSSMK